jgi:hypothetical protein
VLATASCSLLPKTAKNTITPSIVIKNAFLIILPFLAVVPGRFYFKIRDYLSNANAQVTRSLMVKSALQPAVHSPAKQGLFQTTEPVGAVGWSQ